MHKISCSVSSSTLNGDDGRRKRPKKKRFRIVNRARNPFSSEDRIELQMQILTISLFEKGLSWRSDAVSLNFYHQRERRLITSHAHDALDFEMGSPRVKLKGLAVVESCSCR